MEFNSLNVSDIGEKGLINRIIEKTLNSQEKILLVMMQL